MIGALTLYDTTIGKKVIMAVTGVIWYGYVILHLWGNLKIYTGATAINSYAGFLRTVGEPLFSEGQLLWIARVILGVSLVLHIVAASQLTRRDLVSRPVGYATRRSVASGYNAPVMRWGGVAIALFLIFHILHLTTGTVHGDFMSEDVYHNMVAGFANPLISGFYIAAMVALGLHLYHGIWSMAQTLGWRTRQSDGFWRGLATISAVVLAGGNILIPLSVLVGFVR